MIVSTFPGFSEQEALRELSPTDSDSDARHSTSEASTMMRTPDGRLAGWISAEPSNRHSLCKMERPGASENDYTDGPSSPASCVPLGLRDNNYLEKTRTEGTAFFMNGVAEGTSSTGRYGCGSGASCAENSESSPPPPRGLLWDHQPFVYGELKASRRVRRGDVVAVERPLVALQNSEAMPWVVACPGCLRHVGSLDVQLALATGSVDRTDAFNSGSRETDVLPPQASVRQHQSNGVVELAGSSDEEPDKELEESLPPIAGLSTRFAQSPVPCAAGCGAIFCSDTCRSLCWDLSHSMLCLGVADDEDHPLVRHKLHAVAHPDLEAPLLLASQLLVQAARAVALERLTDRYPRSESGATNAFPIASPAPITVGPASGLDIAAEALGDSDSRSPVTNCNRSEGGEPPKMARGVSAAVNVVPPSTTGGVGVGVGDASGVASGTTYGSDKSGNEVKGRRGDGEAAAARFLTEAIVPRGRFREGSSCAPTAAVVRESWALLVEALAVEARGAKKQDCVEAGDQGNAAAIVVDPEDFPLLLGERLHADVVGVLAANLLDVEVRSPLVEYCEALVTQDCSVQHRALQVLEPALRAMDAGGNNDSEDDDDDDQPPLFSGSPMKISTAGYGELLHEGLSENLEDADGRSSSSYSRRAGTLTENRASARLAWRCLEAARVAAQVLPTLSVRALLPAAALRLPHSCAPTVRVPAGDPHTYRRESVGVIAGFPMAGAPGWPLSVATVALRDVPLGAPLTCSWVDAGERFSTRMARLREYGKMAAVWPSSRKAGRHNGPAVAPEEVSPCGCGCSKCLIEVAMEQDKFGPHELVPLGTEALLEVAGVAADEDRFDDAAYVLRCAARLSPEDGDVLYRAGVCAINQGRWSRALRLWREGLALSPDHPQLKQEAERYRALAFWLHPPRDIADSASVLPCKEHGAIYLDTRPFSSPLWQSIAASRSLLGGEEDTCDLSPHTDRARLLMDNLNVTFMGGGEWVCETRKPPLSRAECTSIIEEAEKIAAARRGSDEDGRSGNGWGTARHYAVPTTDIAVRDLPRTLVWFNAAMLDRIGPLVAAATALGGGDFSSGERAASANVDVKLESGFAKMQTACVEATKGEESNGGSWAEAAAAAGGAGDIGREFVSFVQRLRVHDAFVVRYDAAAQRSLPLHTDQGELSLTISLNSAEEYEGGGTWFEGLGRAVRPSDPGHVVVFPGGDTVHGGREITSGIRYILAVFLYEHREKDEEKEEEMDEEEGKV